MSDSDAVNSMDPYEAIVCFTSRGDACLSYPSRSAQFLVRDGPLIFRIDKQRRPPCGANAGRVESGWCRSDTASAAAESADT